MGTCKTSKQINFEKKKKKDTFQQKLIKKFAKIKQEKICNKLSF